MKILDSGLPWSLLRTDLRPGLGHETVPAHRTTFLPNSETSTRWDARSDLSMGCTFYYLLPAKHRSRRTAMEADPPRRRGPSGRAKRDGIPDAVAAIVHKLLAKNPKWRYQKASELAGDLTALNSKGGLVLRPPTPNAVPDSASLSAARSIPGDRLRSAVRKHLPTAMMSTRKRLTPAACSPPFAKRWKYFGRGSWSQSCLRSASYWELD